MKKRAPSATPPSSHAPARSCYARIYGHRLHWMEIGDGPPLVLLHGICDSHRTWLEIAPALARDRRVLMLDLPGHGLSARPDASYSVEWHAQMVGTWMEQLGLEDVDLVGHSFGGGVALCMMTTRFRARVRKLALVAAGGLGTDVLLALRVAALPLLFEHLGQAFMRTGTRLGMRLLARGAYDGDEIAHLSAMNGVAGTARAIARTLRNVIGIRGQLRHALDGTCDLSIFPAVALFWGDRDPVVPIAHGITTTSRIAASLTRFEGCGHFPHRQESKAFTEHLKAYLDAPVAADLASAA